MATTTGGTTYVTSTDLVADYPTASLALANRVDVVASGGPVLVKTAGYTITVADILSGNKFLYNSASGGTFTLPTSSLVDGMVIEVAQIGAGALTVSGGTIVGTTVTTAQYQGLRFVYASTGTTWYSIAPNATAPGLAIVTPTSIASSGGSSSASGGEVTFTGVTSISLNGVFTSTYLNYKVVANFDCSASNDYGWRARNAGTDVTGASEYSCINVYGTNAGGTAGVAFADRSFGLLCNTGDVANSADITFFEPFSANNTRTTANSGNRSSGGSRADYSSVTRVTAASHDGFTIYLGGGNITGTIRVYGLKNS